MWNSFTLVTPPPEHLGVSFFRDRTELLDDARLSDTRFAREDDEQSTARLGVINGGQQPAHPPSSVHEVEIARDVRRWDLFGRTQRYRSYCIIGSQRDFLRYSLETSQKFRLLPCW